MCALRKISSDYIFNYIFRVKCHVDFGVQRFDRRKIYTYIIIYKAQAPRQAMASAAAVAAAAACVAAPCVCLCLCLRANADKLSLCLCVFCVFMDMRADVWKHECIQVAFDNARWKKKILKPT